MHTLIFLKDVKIVPGFGDASYLNFLFVVLSLFWGNRNSIFLFHIYQRHFTSNENAFSNCLGRAKRGLVLGGVFFLVLVCFEVTQIETISENMFCSLRILNFLQCLVQSFSSLCAIVSAIYRHFVVSRVWQK